MVCLMLLALGMVCYDGIVIGTLFIKFYIVLVTTVINNTVYLLSYLLITHHLYSQVG